MMTPQEYLAQGMPSNNELWVNGLDLIAHCLQADVSQSFYQDDRPAMEHYETWSEAMQEKSTNTDKLQEIYDNAYKPEQTRIRFMDETGALDIGAYISGEELCFGNERKIDDTGEALSIVMDMSVPYRYREDKYMETRQQKVYDLVAQCDSEQRPVQIVGAYCRRFPELNKPLNIFVVIKDYSDSIFPTIWGALKTNLTTNCFLNCIADFFIGTHAGSNGNAREINDIERFFPENEQIVVFGDTFIKSKTATIIGD